MQIKKKQKGKDWEYCIEIDKKIGALILFAIVLALICCIMLSFKLIEVQELNLSGLVELIR